MPRYRRWLFPRLRRLLTAGLAPATALRGPRRVGKTVLLRQLQAQLLSDGAAPKRILYAPFDELRAVARAGPDPILALAHWFEEAVLGESFNEAARAGRTAFLLFDEVQNLRGWAPQVKHLVDNHDVRVLLTGSSSLRIAAGSESLAGRVTTLELGPLLLREIAGLRSGYSGAGFWPDNGLEALVAPEAWRAGLEFARRASAERREAFQAYSGRGGYPVAHERPDTSWPELADYLNESVVRRALEHDLQSRGRARGGDAALLEEVFRLACRYAGQSAGQAVFVPDLQQTVAAEVTWSRVRATLRFLEETLLLRVVPPLELRLKRQAAPGKICLCDPALRAAWLQEVLPLDPDRLAAEPHLTELAGRLAESVIGYFFASIPLLDVAYFPSRGIEPEVDFVLTVGTRRIPVEVKYRRRIDPFKDTRGLRAFLEKTVYNAPLGLLVTLEDDVTVPDPRIVPISLSSLLWLR